MKILVEDKVTDIDAEDLSIYLGDNSQHKPELMLNDYPTVQWISSLPDNYSVVYDEFGNDTGRKRITARVIASGMPSVNGIYLGNFNGDSINYNLYKEDTSSNYVSIGNTTIPIRIFNSFGHFVRGKPVSYQDYLYTLTQLNFTEEYLSSNFRLEIEMQSDVNMLVPSSINFNIESVIDLTYFDSANRNFWKLCGNFQDSNGDSLRMDSDLFAEELHVGMVMFLELSGDNRLDVPTDQAIRLAQITEIRGDGSGSKSITLLVRDYEVATQEESLTTKFSGITFNSSTVLGQTQSEGSWSNLSSVTYLFTSMRIGLLRVGYIEHFPNPQVGLSRTYRDYSIRKNLLNGGHQYLNRNIAKTYSGKMMLDRDRVRRFLTFAEEQRAKPFPVEVISDMEEETPTVFYGYFTNSPSENISQRNGAIRDIDFSIQQVF